METRYGICAEDNLSSGGEARSYHVSTVSKQDAVAAERLESEAMSKRPISSLTSQSSPYAASIVLAKELHSKASERSCVHVEFDISGTGISYQHGDHLGVFAENMFPVVQRAAASQSCHWTIPSLYRCPMMHLLPNATVPDALHAQNSVKQICRLAQPSSENCSCRSGICRNRRLREGTT